MNERVDHIKHVDIHRRAAHMILDGVPVRPGAAYSLLNPLGYLTSKCISFPEVFQKRESDCSKRIFGWRDGLDLKIRKQLNQIISGTKWERPYNPPLVIRANSGAGKSILLAKVFAELIEHIVAPTRMDKVDKIKGEEEWPKFSQVVFSQLKNNQWHDNLYEAVFHGIQSDEIIRDHRDLNRVFPTIENIKKILIVDSLDEHNAANDWYDFSKQLGNDWIIIWACRDPDWELRGLGDKIDKFDKIHFEQDAPWDQFSDVDWDLKITDHRWENLRKRNINAWNKIETQSADSSRMMQTGQWFDLVYRKNQLMHLIYTNDDLKKNIRENIDFKIYETIRENRSKLLNGEIWKFEPNNLDKYIENASVVKILLRTIIQQISENYMKKFALKWETWFQYICLSVEESNQDLINAVKNARLNEIISGTDRFVPEEEANEFEEWCEVLVVCGLLMEVKNRELSGQGNKIFRFRHRDFAMIAFLEGVKIKGAENNEQEALTKLNQHTMFKHRFLSKTREQLGVKLQKFEENKSSKSIGELLDEIRNELNLIDDNLRRTGFLLSDIVENNIQKIDCYETSRKERVPKDIFFVLILNVTDELSNSLTDWLQVKVRVTSAKNIKLEGEQTIAVEEDIRKDVTNAQKQIVVNAVRHGKTIVLRGFPGTGKTFTGVERILASQVKQKNMKSQDAVIIALNKNLARSIDTDLYNHHINSKIFSHIDEVSEKRKILDTIQVVSLEDMICFWAPDFKLRISDQWLISDRDLLELFSGLGGFQEQRKFSHLWRSALTDFQRNMFDSKTGRIIEEEDYLNEDLINKNDNHSEEWIKNENKIREKWYREVRRLNKQKFALPEASIILRNRFLLLEWIDSGQSKDDFPTEYSLNKDLFITPKNKIIYDLQERIAGNVVTRLSSGDYGSFGLPDLLMIDEVQDIPYASTLMLSFLLPKRSVGNDYHRFVISGDDNQTLNANRFNWNDFAGWLTREIKDIANDFKELIRSDGQGIPINHHLSGLANLNEHMPEDLVDNHRNAPAIVNYTKQCDENWPTWVDQKKRKSKISNMEVGSKNEWHPSRGNVEPVPTIIRLQAENWTDYLEMMSITLQTLNSKAQVSLLFIDNVLMEISDGFMNFDISNQKIDQLSSVIESTLPPNLDLKSENISQYFRVESFNAWDIKGLERDVAVLFGSYFVSNKDPENKLLFANDNSEPGLELMKRKMLVCQTRARKLLLIIDAPLTKMNPAGGAFAKEIEISGIDSKYKQFDSPVSDDVRYSDYKYSNISSLAEEYFSQIPSTEKNAEILRQLLTEFIKSANIKESQASLEALFEGIQLAERAQINPDIELEFNLKFKARWNTISNLDQKGWEQIFKVSNRELIQRLQNDDSQQRDYNDANDLRELGEFLIINDKKSTQLRKLMYHLDFNDGTAKDMEPFKNMQLRNYPIINDMLTIKLDELSSHSLDFIPNKYSYYSKLIETIRTFKSYTENPRNTIWKMDVFDFLVNIYKSYLDIKEKIQTSRRYLGNEDDKLNSLKERYELLVQNEMNNLGLKTDIKSIPNNTPEVIKQIFCMDSKIHKFHKIQPKIENIEEISNVLANLLLNPDRYHIDYGKINDFVEVIYDYIKNKKIDIDSVDYGFIDEWVNCKEVISNSSGFKLLYITKKMQLIQKYRIEIIDFLNDGSQGMEEEEEKLFIKTIIDKDPDFLSAVDDTTKWSIPTIVGLIEAENKTKASNQSAERSGNKLAIESRNLDVFIQKHSTSNLEETKSNIRNNWGDQHSELVRIILRSLLARQAKRREKQEDNTEVDTNEIRQFRVITSLGNACSWEEMKLIEKVDNEVRIKSTLQWILNNNNYNNYTISRMRNYLESDNWDDFNQDVMEISSLYDLIEQIYEKNKTDLKEIEERKKGIDLKSPKEREEEEVAILKIMEDIETRKNMMESFSSNLVNLIMEYPALGYIFTKIGEEEYSMEHYLNLLNKLPINRRILEYLDLDFIDIKDQKKQKLKMKRVMKKDGFIGLGRISLEEQIRKMVNENEWIKYTRPKYEPIKGQMIFNHNKWTDDDFVDNLTIIRMKLKSYENMVTKISKYVDFELSKDIKYRQNIRETYREIFENLFVDDDLRFALNNEGSWIKSASENDNFLFYTHPIFNAEVEALAVSGKTSREGFANLLDTYVRRDAGKVPEILEVIHHLLGISETLRTALAIRDEYNRFYYRDIDRSNWAMKNDKVTLERMSKNLQNNSKKIKKYLEMVNDLIFTQSNNDSD